jgi:hypothetical protein
MFLILTQTISETLNIVILEAIFMTEQPSKQGKNKSALPKVPPLHEVPIEGLSSAKEICKICGKAFKTHSELDRHVENVHGTPEKTHTGPHRVE